jgi:hypothetical protein
VILRVPNASTRIFFVSLTQIHTSRAHPCAYTRPHRTDPGVLPSWIITAFEFHCDNTTQESHVAVLFDWLNIHKISSCICQLFYEYLPMGVITFHFVDYVVKVAIVAEMLATCPLLATLYFSFRLFPSIGCVLSAPDGSSPRGYSRNVFEYRLKT